MPRHSRSLVPASAVRNSEVVRNPDKRRTNRTRCRSRGGPARRDDYDHEIHYGGRPILPAGQRPHLSRSGASQYLVLGAKARAALQGRPAAPVEDVRAIAIPVLGHRIGTIFHAAASGVRAADLVRTILESVRG